MRILVTGSSGLIGTKLCEQLERLGHLVRRFDINPSLSTYSAPEDILDAAARKEAINNIDGVIHLAAVSRVIDAELDSERCIKVNVNGTQALISDLVKSGEYPWLIYGSSREVYGIPEKIPADENLEPKPVNVYGESKVAAESSVREYNESTGATSIIFRFSNVYGSVNDHATRVIPAFIRSALIEENIRIDGNDHVFDFTHVDDTVNAIIKAVSMIEMGVLLGCHTLNVCTERGTNLGELVNIIVSITHTKPSIIQGEPRKYDVPYFIGSSTKLSHVLGVNCKIALEDGITLLVEDFKQHLESSSAKGVSSSSSSELSTNCPAEEGVN
ncbi:NAD-dependent epimerase/dehydratase family protein [Methanolobus chelungpuianus]|uniref:NAD-dependent epimerase/dehydratase family protein n=1 Tax=Methanolobus chelungpuianus TaxID=502115 RepID=UPI0021154E76|nr:NAD(P)-dependent oxidoreductase [Methanolobus chelungpuianus]